MPYNESDNCPYAQCVDSFPGSLVKVVHITFHCRTFLLEVLVIETGTFSMPSICPTPEFWLFPGAYTTEKCVLLCSIGIYWFGGNQSDSKAQGEKKKHYQGDCFLKKYTLCLFGLLQTIHFKGWEAAGRMVAHGFKAVI